MCFACSPFAGALAGALYGPHGLAANGGPGAPWPRLLERRAASYATPRRRRPRAVTRSMSAARSSRSMTRSPGRPEAVLVRGGKIVAVGTRAEVENQAKEPMATVDLNGKALLPGFVDPHGHVVMVGLQALAANLLPAPDGEGNDIAALQRILRGWTARNGRVIDRYGFIIGFGYDNSQLKEQRHPTRTDLDAVSSDTPILIVHQSGHLGVLNSKALDQAGVTKGRPIRLAARFGAKPTARPRTVSARRRPSSARPASFWAASTHRPTSK